MTLRTEAGDSAVGEDAAHIARADRLAGLQIRLDDAAENLPRPVVERGKPVGAHVVVSPFRCQRRQISKRARRDWQVSALPPTLASLTRPLTA